MAAAPPNPLAKGAVSATLGIGADPADELKNDLAQRRKKALQGMANGNGMVSRYLG